MKTGKLMAGSGRGITVRKRPHMKSLRRSPFFPVMILKEVMAAVQRGKPFILRTIVGKEYSVSQPEKVIFSDEGSYLIIIPKNEPPAVVLLEKISEIVFS